MVKCVSFQPGSLAPHGHRHVRFGAGCCQRGPTAVAGLQAAGTTMPTGKAMEQYVSGFSITFELVQILPFIYTGCPAVF